MRTLWPIIAKYSWTFRCFTFPAVVLAVGAGVALSDPTTQPTASVATAGAPAALRLRPSRSALDPAIAAEVRKAVAEQSCMRSNIQGGAFAQHPFEDVCRDGVLVGFHIGLGYFFNTEVIKYIEPIYLTPRGLVTGQGFGNADDVERSVKTIAPAGYALGAVDIRGGGGLDAMTITYMRFNGTRIDPTDVRMTTKIGGGVNGGGLLDGDGTPIIGICGKQSGDGKFLGLGLIFVKPTAMVEHR